MVSYRPGLEILPVYNTAGHPWAVKLDANESSLEFKIGSKQDGVQWGYWGTTD